MGELPGYIFTSRLVWDCDARLWCAKNAKAQRNSLAKHCGRLGVFFYWLPDPRPPLSQWGKRWFSWKFL